MAVLFSLLVAGSSQAATSELRVLLDLHNDPATGCTSNGFSGAEQLIVTKFDAAPPAHVLSVARS
ncbi:MAG: hypothetical protein ACXW2Q_11415, partial [Thermoanaerobaculia bacterium]